LFYSNGDATAVARVRKHNLQYSANNIDILISKYTTTITLTSNKDVIPGI